MLHAHLAGEQHVLTRLGLRAAGAVHPPGFLGSNYGLQTPIWALVSHAVFGAVLGAFYWQATIELPPLAAPA